MIMPFFIVDIAVGISVNKTFHYLAPEEMRERLVEGSRVLVPFGSRTMTGTVLGFPEKKDAAALKSIIEIIDSPLTPDLLALAHWMADYYLYPLGPAIDAMVPGAIGRAKPKKQKYLQLTPAGRDAVSVRGPKQKELLLFLCGHPVVSLEGLKNFSSATIKSLCDNGMASIIEKDAEKTETPMEFVPGLPPALMPEQADAVRRISEAATLSRFGVFLLHGVTGSGKTEVYLHSIKQQADRGRGTIVLVPEIALTPQLLGRFQRRFGSRVAVLHSGLTDRERADEYRRIQTGQVDVAVGARSAVFAPFDCVGLIIVDEEHENSYKQDEGLRYHARDVAVMRAKLQNAVAVLGSATPSLESYYNAKNGKYQYLRLAQRVDHRPMPKVEVIDVKSFVKQSLYSPASRAGE